jgi:alpha-1,2-mannosyltransferase
MPLCAGVVPIAHNSGGPREDIVVPEGGPGSGGNESVQRTGWLCSGLGEYAAAICQVLGMDQRERLRVAAAARRRAAQFSDQRFQQGFMACMEPLLPQGRRCQPSNVMPHQGH